MFLQYYLIGKLQQFAMMTIGLLSDTHGWLDSKVFHYFMHCDEVWHAGDIGSMELVKQLTAFKRLRAVYGNIDGKAIRSSFPKDQRFVCEGLHVWMTHIGGTPPRYTTNIQASLQESIPNMFVCGHSHILRVMHDPTHPPLLYLNPGAAGQYGFHTVRTLLRFEIAAGKVRHMQAIELGPRSQRHP